MQDMLGRKKETFLFSLPALLIIFIETIFTPSFYVECFSHSDITPCIITLPHSLLSMLFMMVPT